MKSIRYTFAVLAALLLGSAAAAPAAAPAAQAAAPAPAQPAAQPQDNGAPRVTDVKEFGDWTVRCYDVKSLSPCEMLEVRVAKKNGQRILAFLVAYIPSRDEHVIQVAVPLGVNLANGLVVDTDTWKSGVLKFHRCDIQGCYVETAIDGNAVNSLSRATRGNVQVVYMDGKKYDLVFSLKGFTDAHKALVDLTKAKATGAPAAPSEGQGEAPQQ